MITQEERLLGLCHAVVTLSSELSLDSVLQKFVDTARELTDARYGALGVIDPSGRELERFIVSGVDEETIATIGEPPRGRGVLGVLIKEAKPIRLSNISVDPRSVGFPPGHPPMRSFLGVPIILRGVAYGNLYLTDKTSATDFTDEDEELITILAVHAAIAVENARLYESATRWSRQLESLNEIGNALASEMQLPALLELVTERLRELLNARVVAVALPAPDGDLLVETASGDGSRDFTGLRLSLDDSKSGRVLQRKRSERVDSVVDDPEVDQAVARSLGAVSGLYIPLIVGDEAIGVIMAHDKRSRDSRFTDDDVRLAEVFATRASTALDLSQRVARVTFRQVLEAQELERRRLARELHDETGQALTSVLLGLRAVEEANSERELAGLEDLRGLVVGTLQDVRRLAVELRPKLLDDFGLVPALERLTETLREQTGIDIVLEARLPENRLPQEIETAIFRIVQEALTNVIKHARAERVSVLLTEKSGGVTTVIEDDGRGFIHDNGPDHGLGLVGMRERVALLGGRLSVESSETSGTTIVAEIPIP